MPHPTEPADAAHLAHAVGLSRIRMRSNAGGPFGAVIVSGDGTVLAEGWNEVTSTNDPTAHAEVVAIRRACVAVGSFQLSGSTLFSSCEPCPMCLAAAYWARIGRIVYANTREQAAAIGFDDAFIYDEIPLPPESRTIVMVHRPSLDGAAVFAEWAAKPDRIDY